MSPCIKFVRDNRAMFGRFFVWSHQTRISVVDLGPHWRPRVAGKSIWCSSARYISRLLANMVFFLSRCAHSGTCSAIYLHTLKKYSKLSNLPNWLQRKVTVCLNLVSFVWAAPNKSDLAKRVRRGSAHCWIWSSNTHRTPEILALKLVFDFKKSKENPTVGSALLKIGLDPENLQAPCCSPRSRHFKWPLWPANGSGCCMSLRSWRATEMR